MNGSLIKEARKRVRNLYGKALEEKASDELVMKLAGRTRRVGLEAFAPPEPAVVELEPESELADKAKELAREVKESPVWKELADKLGEVAPSEKRRSLSAKSMVREATIREMRRSFTERTGAVREALEKAVASTMIGDDPNARYTEACWLNQTLRTASTTPALADVAAEARIKGFDVPRLIRAEVASTAAIIGAPAFREAHGLTGKDVTLAVIDAEVAQSHPAFGDRLVRKENYTKEPWGAPHFHGTAVAGIAASSDAAHSGIAPGATIFHYKVIATDWTLNADDFGGALAIQQALEDGADVANCSWGAGPVGDGTSREARACDNAWALGMTIVKSAGNGGPGGGTLTTPADADGIIVVGATNRAGDRIEDYSSRGPTGDGRNRPHLVCPGGDQNSTGITSAAVGGGFADARWGTSFAAPHVTGMIALMLERDPDLTPDELRDELLRHCHPIGQLDADVQGAGLLKMILDPV